MTTVSAASADAPPRTKDKQCADCEACQCAARALSIGLSHNLPLLPGSSSSALPEAGYDLQRMVG